MKLATLKDGTRDGQLIVVSRDLQTAAIADAIAPTLQRVLEDWHFYAPQLRTLYEALNSGRVRRAFKFDAKACMAPLPRSWRCIDATMPLAGETGGGEWFAARRADALHGAREDIIVTDDARQLTLRSGVAALLSDVAPGATPMEAVASVRLLTVFASFRSPASASKSDVGSLAAPMIFDATAHDALAFAPVAVTPDVFGDDWHHGVLRRRIELKLNGQRLSDGSTDKPVKSRGAGANRATAVADAVERTDAADGTDAPEAGEGTHVAVGDLSPEMPSATVASPDIDAAPIVGKSDLLRADIGGFATVGALLARAYAISAGTLVLAAPGLVCPDSRPLTVGDRIAVDLRDDRGTSYCGPIETGIAPRSDA